MSRIFLLVILVLFMVASCTMGNGTPPIKTPILPFFTPPSPVVHSNPLFQVFILESLVTCLVGNEFASGNVCAGTECGDCNCTWEQHDPPAPQVGVPPERINDPEYSGYAYRICVDLTLSDKEVKDIIADMELVKSLVYDWTDGALDLQMEYTVLSHVFTGFTAPDFVIGPFEIDDDLLDAYVGTDTDFIYVISGVYDRAQDLQMAYWCGSSYGEYSIHGATYSYIQYNHEACNTITLSGEIIYEALMHEWIHSLDWALYYVDLVPDLYQDVGPDWVAWDHDSWPACGKGDPDPLAWFPNIDFCEWDPDWKDCNNTTSAGSCLHAGETDGGISWYEHVISAHYPRAIEFNGNFCADGRQDFSETGVDTGWPCP